MNSLKLKDKIAIITGADGAIGSAVAKLFADEGAVLVLTAFSDEGIKKLQDEIDPNTMVLPMDSTDLAECQKMTQYVVDTYGRIDILVNNAGTWDGYAAITRTSSELWAYNLEVNQNAAFRLTKAVIGHMTAADSGCIINVSSVCGTYSIGGAAYSSSKLAIMEFQISAVSRPYR